MHEQYILSLQCTLLQEKSYVRCEVMLQSFIGIADVACRGLWCVWLEISQKI